MTPTLPTWRLAALTTLAMLAFAGNSVLCRMALKTTALDAASFTTVRLLSGAAMLWLLVWLRQRATASPQATPPDRRPLAGNWGSALALFAYAALFSFAYVGMSTGTGALLLFGAVQASMIGWGLTRGERLRPLQWLGFAVALAGLVTLMLPGVVTPALPDALAMLGAGVAWGIYSLRGKATTAPAGAADPVATTCGNFVRTVPMALLLLALAWPTLRGDAQGLWLAVVSGAVTSGLGYALWYRALPALQATHAATVQLSVPVLAALGGVLLLGEAVSWPLAASSVAILGGIALVLARPQR